MTSSVRYKFIENNTVTPLTVDNFVSNCLINNDGDDKQVKFLKRIITDADIGNGAGQIGEPYGAILDVIPSTSTVLWFEINVYRPQTILQQGMTLYNNIDSDVTPLNLLDVPSNISQVSFNFGLGLDNTLRIADKGYATPSAIVAGDVVTATIILGTKTSAFDKMNP